MRRAPTASRCLSSSSLGHRSASRWPTATYTEERQRSRIAGPAMGRALMETVARVKGAVGVERVHLLAHSMGNWALRWAVQSMEEYEGGNIPPLFEQIVSRPPTRISTLCRSTTSFNRSSMLAAALRSIATCTIGRSPQVTGSKAAAAARCGWLQSPGAASRQSDCDQRRCGGRSHRRLGATPVLPLKRFRATRSHAGNRRGRR